jgi:hypothetical protein
MYAYVSANSILFKVVKTNREETKGRNYKHVCYVVCNILQHRGRPSCTISVI